eukprot:CAMPEP_0180236624 /NCGR_PEP_ID=MMETSP0987-20121128/29886_1 /TAXON_ID=697907 /ORGANISM="non described non described, Strain CCMP2293" /LENGTH=176 /DNA_ID=CAMNT_0022202877 /DNA_START=79 /DNA_END=606 /DNA_ORIENTATION=+
MKTLKGILQSKDMRQNDHRDDDMESPSAEPLSKKRVSGGKDGAEMQERPAGGHVPEVDEKEALLGGGGDWQSDASPATPGSLPAMMDGVPRVFRASWPSVLDQFMYTLRPALDVWCWFAFFLCFIYGPEHPLLYVLRGAGTSWCSSGRRSSTASSQASSTSSSLLRSSLARCSTTR